VQQAPAAALTEDEMDVVFSPATQKLPSYAAHCAGWMPASLCPPARISELCRIVKRYTQEEGRIYFKVNMALALDYEAVIADERDFIRRLVFAILILPGYSGTTLLRRGMNLDDKEIKAMSEMGEFYFPSFTSASLGQGFSGNTILEIDASDGERVTLDIANSPYKKYMTDFASEAEVLISCYAKFRFLGVGAQPDSGRRVLRLKLLDPTDDPVSEHREMLDIYEHAKFGRWSQAFQAIDGQPHKAQVMVRYSRPTSGWTMLHQAAWWGNQAAVNQLMMLGANPSRQTRSGQTAEEVVHEYGTEIDWVQAKALLQS